MWSARSLAVAALAAAHAALGGCGYTLRGSTSPRLEREGITRLYVSPLKNESYRAGVENVVYSALVRKISAQSNVAITQRPEDADAVLSGSITTATYSVGAPTTADQLSGADPADRARNRRIIVGRQYRAKLGCRFVLEKRVVKGSEESRKKIWGSSFARSKTYPGNNQLGVLGTTSALINDSELDRTLSDLADNMMGDVYEAMVSVF